MLLNTMNLIKEQVSEDVFIVVFSAFLLVLTGCAETQYLVDQTKCKQADRLVCPKSAIEELR